MTKSNLPSGFTKEMVAASETLFVAIAFEQIIRPVVEAYEDEILQRLQFRTDKCFAERGIDRIVLNRKHTYLLSLQDQAVLFEETEKARTRANLKVSIPGNCPLLEAEHRRIMAEQAFLESIAEHPNLGNLKNTMPLETRAHVIELSLRLLAPFVSDAAEILEGLMKAPEA